MSFICGVCNKPQPNGTSPNRLVTATRNKSYPARKYRKGKHTVEDPGGRGTEIVSEVEACNGCVAKN